MSKMIFLICAASLFIMLFMNNMSNACVDSLRDEQGKLVLREWPQQRGIDYAPDQIIIGAKRGAIILPPGQTGAPLSQCVMSMTLRTAQTNARVNYIKRVFPSSLLSDTLRAVDDSTVVKLPDMTNIFNVTLLKNSNVYNGISLLCPLTDILWAEPNAIVHPMAVSNDPLYTNQWNLKPTGFGIDAERAWDVTQGSSLIRIGVIGSGIDVTHGELDGKVMGGHNYNDLGNSNDWGTTARAMKQRLQELSRRGLTMEWELPE